MYVEDYTIVGTVAVKLVHITYTVLHTSALSSGIPSHRLVVARVLFRNRPAGIKLNNQSELKERRRKKKVDDRRK